MTDSYPPVPPAPQQPESQPFAAPGQFQGQPQYNPAPPPQYGQQPYPQQPYQQPSYGQQPQYAAYPQQQYAPQWGQAVPRPKSSGFRVAAGIVGIVLGFFLLIASVVASSYNGFGGFLLVVAALGNLTSGIVLLAMQRGRGRGAPITAISFAGFALLVSFLSTTYIGAGAMVFAVLLGTPILVVMGMGLSREVKAESAATGAY